MQIPGQSYTDFRIYYLRIDTGAFNLTDLLTWKTDNSAIAIVAEDGSSVKAGSTKGTTVITAYRMNGSQVETNEFIRIIVVVN